MRGVVQSDPPGGLHPRLAPIAIVGMACRFAKAPDLAAFWQLLERGEDAIGPSRFGPDVRGGYLDDVDGFDAAFFKISPREAAEMDPQQRLMLELSFEALADAAIAPSSLRGARAGVFAGAIWSNETSLGPYAVTGQHHAIIANRVSYVLGLRGPSFALDAACASGLTAVHLACDSLRRGESVVALAGAVNVNTSAEATEAVAKLGALSPDHKCHAFDARANGYVRGEGGGVLVLKTLAQAVKDGDRVHAVIRGSAVNNDGASNGLTAPSQEAQEELLRAASSGMAVGYVEAHGTGTPVGDPLEARAIKAVYGDVPVGSCKTNIGHTEAAAGIAGLMKTVLAMQHGLIPRSLNFEQGPHGLDVVTAAREWNAHPRRAGVSAFGLGGSNAHVVVESFPAASPQPRTFPDRAVFVCPGQGAQWHGMARDLLRSEPVAREVLFACDVHVRARLGYSLVDVIAEARIDDLRTSLPAIIAIDIALGRYLQSLGVTPVACVGHSTGEIAAAHLAGALDLADTMQIICAYAETISACDGAMLHVDLPFDEASALGDGVYAAIEDSATATVIGGSKAAIARVAARLTVPFRQVAISAAPHCKEVHGVLDVLRARLAGIRPGDTAVPFYSEVTGTRLDGRALDVEHWVKNFAAPARFFTALRAAGDHPLISVGPHPTTAGTIAAMSRNDESRPQRTMAATLVPLSAPSEAQLDALIAEHPNDADSAFSAAVGRDHHAHRAVIERRTVRRAVAKTPRIAFIFPGHVGAPFEEAQARGFLQSVAMYHRLWSLGIRPAAVVGYSLGEVAAAHCAGLIDLPTAEHIVGVRSRLLGALVGKGAMAQIDLPAEQVALRDGLVIAAYKSATSTVVSGDTRAIDDFCARHGARRLDVPLAAHSPQVGVLDLGPVVCHPPALRMVSTVTAEDLRVADARYWQRNVREPVRFAQAIAALEADGIDTFIELSKEPDLAELYLRGVDVDWSKMLTGRRVSVPVFAWNKQHFPRPQRKRATALGDGIVPRDRSNTRIWQTELSGGGIFHAPQYFALAHEACGSDVALEDVRFENVLYLDAPRLLEITRDGDVLTFDSRALDGDRWTHHARCRIAAPKRDGAGEPLALEGGMPIAIARVEAGRVVGVVRQAPRLETAYRVVWKPIALPTASGGGAVIARSIEETLAALRQKPKKLWVLSKNQPALTGLCRTITMELPELRCTRVELEDEDDAILQRLLASSTDEDQLWLRRDELFAARLQRYVAPVPAPIALKNEGAYLVTGGLGGLGMRAARWLRGHGAKRVILASRRLPSTSVDFECVQLDVSKRDDVAAFVAKTPIAGVVHAAGILDDCLLSHLTEEKLLPTFAGKADGARHLDALLPDLEFFVMFSSAATLLGTIAQGAYAAANAILDAIAEARPGALSLRLGLFDAGFGVEHRERLSKRGLLPLTDLDAVMAFALTPDVPRTPAIMQIDWQRWLAHYPHAASPFLEELQIVAASARPVGDIVATHLAAVLGMLPSSIDRERPFRDYGLDSATTLEWKLRLETALGIPLSTALFFTYPTCAALSRALSSTG